MLKTGYEGERRCQELKQGQAGKSSFLESAVFETLLSFVQL